MKKILWFLLFSIQTSIAQNIDSLKTVLKNLRMKEVSIARDSNLTNTLFLLFGVTNLANSKEQKFWKDSLQKFSQKSIWPQGIYKSYIITGLYFQMQGIYAEGLTYLEKALNYYKKVGDIKLQARAMNLISVIVNNDITESAYFKEIDYPKYFRFLNDNLLLAKKSGDIFLIANQEVAMGLFYLNLKNYKEAHKHYENSFKAALIDSTKYFYHYYGGIWAMGLCDLYMNKTEQGFKKINYVKKICETKKSNGYENLLRAVIGKFLGIYYNKNKKYENAIIELQYGEKVLNIVNNSLYYKQYYKAYYDAYKGKNNDKLSLYYFEKLQKLNSENEYVKFLEQKNENQIKYETEQQKNRIQALENKQLQKENENKDLTRNILIISILAGLGLIGYIYQNNIKLSAKNKQLSSKNKEIEEALFKGQTIERKRIGVELHDNLSAKIGAIRWRLESLSPSFNQKSDADFYNNTINALNETYSDVRLIAHNLLPEILEKKGLHFAVEELVAELNSLNKTKFEYVFFGENKRYPNKIEYELYSILLELSNNILKHSKAKKASISIENLENQLKLIVNDDGVGIESEQLKYGMGFKNIKSRLAQLNGTMKIVTDLGFKIEIII